MENLTDEQKQKSKDYQKQYRENMADEQKQRYKNNQKQYKENTTDEEKQKYKEAIKINAIEIDIIK